MRVLSEYLLVSEGCVSVSGVDCMNQLEPIIEERRGEYLCSLRNSDFRHQLTRLEEERF